MHYTRWQYTFLRWQYTFLLALVTTAAWAEVDGDNPDTVAVELDPIVVVASKTARPLSDVVGQVSVIDAEFIERHLVEDLDALLRYEPGLNLENSGTRFGFNAINIRGIGGNRVAIEIDGVPIRDRLQSAVFQTVAGYFRRRTVSNAWKSCMGPLPRFMGLTRSAA